MAKRGRKPAPPKLRLAKLNAGAEPGLFAETRQAGQPPKPETVKSDAIASRLWDELVAMLDGQRTLAPTDVCILTSLCSAYSRLVQARKVIAKEGLTVTNIVSGGTKAHPLLGVESGAAREVATYCSELGLTPTARGRIKTIDDIEEEDDWGVAINE